MRILGNRAEIFFARAHGAAKELDHPKSLLKKVRSGGRGWWNIKFFRYGTQGSNFVALVAIWVISGGSAVFDRVSVPAVSRF